MRYSGGGAGPGPEADALDRRADHVVRLGLRVAGKQDLPARVAAARWRIRDSTTAAWRSMVVGTP